jgi:hypothetical protein
MLTLTQTEYPLCAVFLLQDLDTQRVHRLRDFTKAQLIRPGVAYCVADKVNSADKLYLVIQSVQPDTKHMVLPCSRSRRRRGRAAYRLSSSRHGQPGRSPRACFPGVDAVVCAYIPIGASKGVETGRNAVILFRG